MIVPRRSTTDDAVSRRRFLTLAAATAASAALAACSTGGSPTATPTTVAPTATTAASPTATPATTGSATAGTPAAAAGASSVANTLAPDASPQFRVVAERVMAAMRAAKVPGVSLGIFADGREEYATFGIASVETKQPVTPDTLFQIGSLTKTYTGTATMRLVSQGKIDLDKLVRTYVPDLQLMDPDAAAKVTVRNLLTHTGGWYGDAFFDTGSGDDALARWVTEKLPTFLQLFPVGEYFSYNNAGFSLAGRVIENVMGKPYRAAMGDLVLGPLGLMGTTYVPDEAMQRPYAVGHAEGAGGDVQVLKPLVLPRNVDPAGGIYSTAREQIHYARFHLSDGTANGARIMPAETLKLMQTPQKDIPGQSLKIGMNWIVQPLPGLTLIAHPGDTFGQHTEFVIVPDKGFAFVLLTNAVKGAVAAQSVLLEALGQYFGIGPAAMRAMGTTMASPSASATAIPTVALPPDKLAQYAGRYEIPTATLTLRSENGALTAHADTHTLPGQIVPSIMQDDVPKDARIAFLKDDLGLFVGTKPEDAVAIPFIRKPDGAVGYLSAGLRLVPKVG